MAGSLFIDGEQTGELTVSLQPWASVSGRLVDGDGKPIPNAELWGGNLPVHLWVKQPDGYVVEAQGTHVTDADGRFHIEGLAPGIEYKPVVFDREKRKVVGMGPHVVDLNPGDARALGDVKVVTPEQRKSVARVQVSVDPSRWLLLLELDAPDLDPPVVQYAIFDEDPLPGFKARVARQREFHERQLAQHKGDAMRVQSIRSAGMTVNWDFAFEDVTGKDVHLLIAAPDRSHSITPNAADGKK